MRQAELVLRPVGWVRSSLQALADAPRQGQGAPPARIVAEPWSRDCWSDLQVGDAVFVLTWLDRADRTVMKTHPEDDRSLPLTGIFSTRSPDRPNPIGLHRTVVTGVDPEGIQVANLEVLDGTPVVDVKPVIAPEEGGA